MCGGRFKLLLWLVTFFLFGVSGLFLYLTMSNQGVEDTNIYCQLSGTPSVQGKSTSGQSILVKSDIVSPTGDEGNCLFDLPCIDNACTETDPLPTEVRCWDQSVLSSTQTCTPPDDIWRTYMYVCGGVALVACLFLGYAIYVSGCCGIQSGHSYSPGGRRVRYMPNQRNGAF